MPPPLSGKSQPASAPDTVVVLSFVFLSRSIPGQGDIFVQWIEAMAADPSPPLVTSISYASLQPEDPKIDIERFNTDLCKLSLKVRFSFKPPLLVTHTSLRASPSLPPPETTESTTFR